MKYVIFYNLFQILYDFPIRYKLCDSFALLNIWPNIKGEIYKLLSPKEIEDCLNYDELTSSFLILLKALGARKNFTKLIQKLIIFSDVSLKPKYSQRIYIYNLKFL